MRIIDYTANIEDLAFKVSSTVFFASAAYLFLKRFYLDQIIAFVYYCLSLLWQALVLPFAWLPPVENFYTEQFNCDPELFANWTLCRTAAVDLEAYIFS